jgi:hypothetical protein
MYAVCEKVELEARKQAQFAAIGGRAPQFARLPQPQALAYTAAQLADWDAEINRPGILPYTMRQDANGVPLRIPDGQPGAGRLVEYGYLTPREARPKAGG